MSKNRNLVRENHVRRAMTRTKNENKVMLGYVRTLHPNVYEEAHTYYRCLTKKYPDKKDLSKTADYRRLLQDKVATTGNFELRIELLDSGKTSNSPAEITPNSPAEITPNSPAEITPDPLTGVTPAEITPDPLTGVTPTEITPDPLAGITPSETLPGLDKDSLELLMVDLREDPTIANFLDNLQHELDTSPLW